MGTNNGTYQFKIVGSAMTFNIKVEVNMTPSPLVIDDMEVELGNDVNVYVGSTSITSVSVNGEIIDSSKYSVSDYTLHINSECFKEGDNDVVINDDIDKAVSDLADIIRVDRFKTDRNIPLINKFLDK